MLPEQLVALSWRIDKPLALARTAKAIEQPLERVSGEDKIERLTARSGAVSQPLANRGDEILRCAQAIASMYGRMTFVTRSISANR